MQYAFRDRKNRKRAMRALWISRINAASRELGISYSKLISSLSNKNVQLDRKLLSQIAVEDPNAFKKLLI